MGFSVVERSEPGAQVIGRDAELEAARRALEPELLPAAVVLQGEAGIGKTTVWAAAVAAAGEAGLRVLRAAPVEAEAKLGYAVLGDLLGDVVESALPRLPVPQRRALEVALLLDEADGVGPDERTVAAALLSCLRVLAVAGPVVVAIDDVQWCDAASATVVAFALRRLAREPIGLLVARRVAEQAPLPLGLDRPIGGVHIERVTVGPLSLGALHQVVRRRLDLSLPRPILRRVHDASAGNPFFALEIARAVGGREDLDPGGPLPVPADLHDLVRGRLAKLPTDTRAELAFAAALADPTLAVLERATGDGAGKRLEPATVAGIVEQDDGRIRFTHPLLAAAAYATVGDDERAGMHRRLADVVDDPEQRAHHLAASARHPDPAVAGEVEAAARRALSRGALAAAADLFAAARRLTAAEFGQAARRLTIAEANCWVEVGHSARGRALLQGLLERLEPGRERAEVKVHLGHALAWGFDFPAAVSYLEQAVDEAADDRTMRLTAQRQLMIASLLVCDDLRVLLAHARRTAELAAEAGDAGLLAGALAVQARTEFQLGRPIPTEVVERARALEPQLGHISPMEWPSDYLATVDGLSGRVPQAIEVLERVRLALTERGQDTAAAWTAGRISQLRCLTGDLERSREQALEAYEFSQQAGQPANQATLAATLALVDAHRGADSDARAWAAEALELVEQTGARPARRMALEALGLLELSLGRSEAARDVLDPLLVEMSQAGFAEPAAMRFAIDAVEARLAVGDVDAARSLLDWYQGLAEQVGRASALACCRRSRGLLAASRGEVGDAIELLLGAVELHEAAPIPLDQARTLLALGTVQRRAQRRREARVTLEAARSGFERLGAAAWRQRAVAELGSIGGRAPRGDDLTSAERRVAELVAGGASNRDAAAALFLSPKTVEFHLRNAYRKLGISSRTQLGSRLEN